MNSKSNLDTNQLQSKLDELSNHILTLAEQCQGDCQLLLSLLRSLENLHQQIRENIFNPSLPNTRNALSNLIRDIEETGGWPYIERMKLQEILGRLTETELGKQPPTSEPEDLKSL